MIRTTKSTLKGKIIIKHGFPFLGEYFKPNGNFIILTPGNFNESGGFKFDEKKAKFYSGNIPKEYICKKGDLIVAMTEQVEGLLGSSALVPENNKFLHNQRIGLVHEDPKQLDKTYLYYLFNTKGVRRQIRLSSSGSKVKHTSPDRIYNVEVNLLPINQQQKISAVLSALDSKIGLNDKINAELEQMAKILYDYWFVQFDFPNENGRPYKMSGGKMVWSEESKRDIPEGWTVENLKENSLSKLIKPGIGKFDNEKIYLATADVLNNEINFNADRITFDNRESRANMQPIENSIWFAKMKNSKKILYFGKYSSKYLQNFILSTGFAGLKCGETSLEYLWNFINDERFEFVKDRLAGDKTTQSAINNDAMAYISVLIPENEVLNKFHISTFDLYKKIYINQLENQKLSELRDWLLPMLMNGQVNVV